MEADVKTNQAHMRTRLLPWSASVLSFATLALLNGRAIAPRVGFVSAYAVCMLSFSIIALSGMGTLVLACCRERRFSGGFLAALDTVAGGFVFMLPFALLALVAELLLGWNAAQVFTQAGIMICGTLVGTEAVRLSGGKASRALPPVAGSFLFSFLWALLSAAAQAAAG